MTAIVPYLIELEALRERISTVIATLRSLDRAIEVLDAVERQEVSVKALMTPAGLTITDMVKPPAPVLKAPTPRASAIAPPAKQYPNDAKVRAALTGQWQTVDDIAKRAKLPKGTAYTRLTRLTGAGEVATRPEGKRMLYRPAGTPAQLRPRAVAGTQAAPPAGPPSANGRQASPDAFDTVWSGTKERNGQAPPILSAAGRERKG